ncbi:heavy metal-associated isoprenylated plant protein 36-like [Populus alba x Populus x berolinensis]|nr:heavy metal-associated isoprenylated plant protein 36-like [Populus alba x Populus x berolinensis]
MEKKNAFAPEIHHGHAPRFYFKVNIQCCSACPRRAKETLEKFSGVLAITIDTEQGLVAVTGTIDPQIVIQKFARWGKKAVLCSPEKDPVNGDSSDCSCCDDDSDSECDCDRNYDEKVSKSHKLQDAGAKLPHDAPPVFRPNNTQGMSAMPYGASRPQFPPWWERPQYGSQIHGPTVYGSPAMLRYPHYIQPPYPPPALQPPGFFQSRPPPQYRPMVHYSRYENNYV